jgi:GNAT superfamily N-acetyltransferase
MTKTFREATVKDIPALQVIRHAVKENILLNPLLVTDKDCEEYLTQRGKGWVCEIENKIVGFAIADMQEKSIWALFIHPDHEGKGIGKRLHTIMMNWYFNNTKETVWLTTSPGTRAERFYTMNGWKAVGKKDNGEIKFEMSYNDWQTLGLMQS